MSEEMIQTPSKEPDTVQRENWRTPRYEVTTGKEEYFGWTFRSFLPCVFTCLQAQAVI